VELAALITAVAAVPFACRRYRSVYPGVVTRSDASLPVGRVVPVAAPSTRRLTARTLAKFIFWSCRS
jgi:hypothetical protein